MKRRRSWRADAMAAAASLGGKRFGLLVASSLVATSAIVAGALTGGGSDGALAAALVGSHPAAPAAPQAAPSSAGFGDAAGGPSPAPTQSPEAAPAPLESAPAESPSAPAPDARPSPEAPPPPTPEAGRIKHVFVISLTSPGYEAAFGAESQMPYLSGVLRPKGQLLSGYSLLDEAALPNAIASVSGQPPNQATERECPLYEEFPPSSTIDRRGVVEGAGCLYPVEALTLADQLGAAQLDWRAYVGAMADADGKPASCIHPEVDVPFEPQPGGYAPQRNPFVYFHSLLDLGDCSADDVPLGRLSGDLAKPSSTPAYAFVAPDLCDAGVAGQCPSEAPDGPAAADAFLAATVPEILDSPAYRKDGLLVVAFSSLQSSAATAGASESAGDLKTGALLVSRFAPPGGLDPAPYDPYSLLRSLEDLFGLQELGLAGGARVRSFAPPLLGEAGGGD